MGYDDSLDAFGVHGVGGIWGALATGIFCSVLGTGTIKGMIHGDASQLGKQALGVIAAMVYSFVGTLILGGLVKATIGLRADANQEREGLDITVHGERGYHLEVA